MITYIIMLIISMTLSSLYMKAKDKKSKIIFAICSMIPFIVVAGWRYDVGTDYMYRYVPDYINILNGTIPNNLEPLFLGLIKMCQICTHDYWILFFISAILTYSLIFYEIFKESKNPVLSILIFFISGMFFMSLNLMRQYIAIAILFISYKYMFKKKTIPIFIVGVFIATMFHSISLIFLIAIFLDKKKINPIFFAISTVIIAFAGKYLLMLVINCLKNSTISNLRKYAGYLKMNGDFSWMLFLSELLILVYFLFITYKRKNELKKEEIFYINCQYIIVAIAVLGRFNELFVRLVFIFSIIQIISIPYFYCESKEYFKELKIKDKTIKYSTLCLVVLVCMLSFRMTYSNIIKGSGEILPYKTIFERNSIGEEQNYNE